MKYIEHFKRFKNKIAILLEEKKDPKEFLKILE